MLVVLSTPILADPALDLADYLFDRKSYDEAITEYTRYIYFNPSGDNLVFAYKQIGHAYKNNRLWENAVESFRNAVVAAPDDSVSAELKIDIGVIYIASGNHNLAEALLLKLAYFGKYENIKAKASFYLCINMIYKYKWQEAQMAYTNYKKYTSANTSRIFLSDSLFEAVADTKYKSPRLAKTISTFIPGGGQIYTGKRLDGLNALVINGGLGYLLGNSLVDGNYSDAILNYFMLFLRYYRGNRHNAELLANEYNDNQNDCMADSIFNKLYLDISKSEE